MQVIVPLAGPNFISADGEIKAMALLQGQPFLLKVLSSRPWAGAATDYTFILKDGEETRNFSDQHLRLWYPNATFVFVSSFTRGAACSVLAGVACQQDPQTPLVVDLADILYSSTLDVVKRLGCFPRCGGLALTFNSTNPIYSYLRSNDSGDVIEAAEKRVISSTASAGTYVFRNSAVFLKAVAFAFDNEATQIFNNLFYVCPLYNGVIAQGYSVDIEPVHDVFDFKSLAC